MGQHWYKVSDMPPPYGIHVRVQWEAREFKAVRGKHPSGVDVWAAVKSAGIELIRKIGESAAPEIWQPLFPDKWVGMLPEPISPVMSGILSTENMRFEALEHASSEELAQEMEANRADARAGAIPHEFHGEHQGRPWFYDISRIKYEPFGEVTLRNCEGRLLRALTFAGAGKHRGCPVQLSATAMAAIAEALARGWRDDEDEVRLKLRMLPSDRSDLDVALGWFVLLNPPEFWTKRRRSWEFNRPQKVLLARSLPLPPSFGDIAAEYDVAGGGNGAKRLYDKALSQCLAAANGAKVHAQPVVDQVAALRERNRAYRRAR